MANAPYEPRQAGIEDAVDVARLLHDFNTEFDTPTPGVDVLARRLRELLARQETMAILVGSPGVAVAVITFRSNVWYDGPVALLDELYVVPSLRNRGIGSAVIAQLASHCRARGVTLIEVNVDEGDIDAQRFYDRHGYTGAETSTGGRAFYFFKELDSAPSGGVYGPALL